MTLENLKRLYKHYMGTVNHEGHLKEKQLVEADRMADKAKTGYTSEGKPQDPKNIVEGYDITVEEKPKKEKK